MGIQLRFHGVRGDILPVNVVGNLNRGHGGQALELIADEQFQAHSFQALVQLVGALLMALDHTVHAFLADHG